MRAKTNEKNVSIAEHEMYKQITNDIKITAILSKVYAYKMSNELVNTKVKNQLNAINFSVNQINPKFADKSKNYGKVSNEILNTMSNYEKALQKLCAFYDEKLDELILDKVEIENKILLKTISENFLNEEKTSIKKKIVKTVGEAIDKIKGKLNKNEVVDVGLINKLQDGQDIENEMKKSKSVNQNITILKNELDDVKQKIKELNEKKENKIMLALESDEKGISTDLRKPRTFKKIKRFFSNRFNTYNVIIKSVILPINQRVEELIDNEIYDIDEKNKYIELKDFENKIKEIQKRVLKEENERVMFN